MTSGVNEREARQTSRAAEIHYIHLGVLYADYDALVRSSWQLPRWGR